MTESTECKKHDFIPWSEQRMICGKCGVKWFKEWMTD